MTFAERVYDAVKRIPKGRVATYGQIAEIIGCPGGARAIGNALHVNPFAPIVPCHRVVTSDGSLAENFGCGGARVQYERLVAEGVSFLPVQANAASENAIRPITDAPDGTVSGNEPWHDGIMPRVDMGKCSIVIERHPLEPFLPHNARILFLGSFPPPRNRWSMEFFYPNKVNDFWRIQGLVHFGDAHHFETENGFDRKSIVEFCKVKGLAFYDTAAKVCRWKGNASDEFLEILEPADLNAMLRQMPDCRTVVTTGGKSSEELASIIDSQNGFAQTAAAAKSSKLQQLVPAVGAYADINIAGREVRWWRMPSSSRAYPMPLKDKAREYSKL